MLSIRDPGPNTGMLLLAGHLLPLVKCLLANRQVVSILPDSEDFLVLAARPGEVTYPIVDPTKLQVSDDPICGERILENYSAILEDLLPSSNCSIPFVLRLIGTRHTLVRGKLRILRHSRQEQFDSWPEPSLRQCNLTC